MVVVVVVVVVASEPWVGRKWAAGGSRVRLGPGRGGAIVIYDAVILYSIDYI